MTIKEDFIITNMSWGKRYIKPKGLMLHSIGVPQPDPQCCADSFKNPNYKASVHGIIGTNEDIIILMPCLDSSTLAMRAWHCGGNGNNTHLGFEMTEPGTIKYKPNSSNWIDLDPQNTEWHVRATYKSAVEFFAFLCELWNLNPLKEGVIISHSEGKKMGIASNHADVEHLWNSFGLSMDKFRNDVLDKMKEEEEEVTQEKFNEMMENYLKEKAMCSPESWSSEDRKWAEENGIIVGDELGNKMYKSWLTREQMCALLHRYDKLEK